MTLRNKSANDRTVEGEAVGNPVVPLPLFRWGQWGPEKSSIL